MDKINNIHPLSSLDMLYKFTVQFTRYLTGLFLLGVHRNGYCKLQPEPELTLCTGTGTDFMHQETTEQGIHVYMKPRYIEVV